MTINTVVNVGFRGMGSLIFVCSGIKDSD